MKNTKKERIKVCMVMLLAASALSMAGCGKKKDEGLKADLEDLMDDAQETFGGTEDADGADDYDSMDLADDSSLGEEGSAASWRGDCFRFELEGENADAINGKVTSILFSGNSWVYASTANGGLYMLWPSIYFGRENSEIEFHQITDGSGISDLAYADAHTAYGNGHLVYFDMVEGYDEEALADLYMLESVSDMPDLVYTFENMQKKELPDAQNLIYLTEDAAFCVYEDTAYHVRAGYQGSSDETYTVYEDVAFEGDTERTGVTVDKSIFGFVLTTEQELLYIKKANVTSDLADNVKGVSVSYTDLTDQIDGKVTDIYSILNSVDCCYAVDEEQNIYYVSTISLDNVTVEKITQFENGTIADIQGFAGKYDEMLIRTAEGAYYFCDGDGLYPTITIDALDESYQGAVLLMDGNLLALGGDGYLYVVEDKN